MYILHFLSKFHQGILKASTCMKRDRCCLWALVFRVGYRAPPFLPSENIFTIWQMILLISHILEFPNTILHNFVSWKFSTYSSRFFMDKSSQTEYTTSAIIYCYNYHKCLVFIWSLLEKLKFVEWLTQVRVHEAGNCFICTNLHVCTTHARWLVRIFSSRKMFLLCIGI